MSTKRAGKDDISSVWKAFHKSGAVELRNRLVEHYLPLVNKLAEILARRLWPRVSADELASAGFEGLIAAVSGFDPARGVKFETYCRQRIVGAIRDWQREIDPLGRSGRNFERQMNALEERHLAQTGRPAGVKDVAQRMGLTVSKFMGMRRSVMASHCVPLDLPAERNDEARSGSFMPADPQPGPVHHTERELIREHITRGLKEQDRLIITLYYYERLTMAEIGSVLGVSESRVCQRHAEILDHLRVKLADEVCDLVA